ncbi:MAG: class I SAM-dependent methyltransferase [Candidatus Sulfotelmatobacter sp.]|jgi:SAM-dependent methyltransferase
MNIFAEFDCHADTYDEDLNQALSLSGEKKDYFARKRVQWLARRLVRLGENPCSALDYGCGIGDTSVFLREFLRVRTVLGLDVSTRSIERARSSYSSDACHFLAFADYQPAESMDLAYCNGVFHHIPPAQRGSAIAYIYKCLRPGGLFALWENNPWNPGTRYVMKRCVFDRDAVTITPPQAVRILSKGGFQILGVDYRFFFPRFLKSLRFLESGLSWFPLGGQYQVLCRRPGVTSAPAPNPEMGKPLSET